MRRGEGLANPTDPYHTPTIIQPSTSQPQQKQRSRRPKRKDTEIPQSSGPIDNVADEAVIEELDDSLVRVATTATGLDAKRDSGNIDKIQSKVIPNEPSSLGTSSGGGPRRQETMGDTIAQTRSENVSKQSNDPLLARGNTLQSGKDSLKLQELTEFCTKLQQRVLDLENTKTAQAQEITSLKLRVKKLEKKGGSRTHKLKRLYKVGRSLCDKVVIETKIASKDMNLSVDKVTLAQALIALKTSTRPKAKGLVIHKEEQATTPTLVIHEQEQAPTPIVSSQQPSQAKIQDKGKVKMIKPEPMKKLSKKDQLKLDEEVAQRLQVEFDEQERIEREKSESNIALKETWDDIQAKIKADCLLAKRLQTREQEELTIEERAILFQQILEKRRKHFAAKRVEEKRNRPPTKSQQRSIMCTYLKNIDGWKPKDLKNKSFDSIQKLFDKSMKRVNIFVDMDTELVKESSKKADAEIA
ncbi:hypothetical protein Tco_1125791 [Tanacetum coccineum]